MDKLVKITLLVIGLSVVFIWISNSFISCKSDSAKEELAEYGDNDAEELFEGDEIDYSTTDPGDDPIQEEIVDDLPEDEVAGSGEIDFTAPPVKKDPGPPARERTPVGSASGDYMVIAGNYLIKDNAENMTVKLKDLGYRDAYIAVFDNSQYHTVIADRYSSYQTASETANALKRQGVECYVKRKQ